MKRSDWLKNTPKPESIKPAEDWTLTKEISLKLAANPGMAILSWGPERLERLSSFLESIPAWMDKHAEASDLTERILGTDPGLDSNCLMWAAMANSWKVLIQVQLKDGGVVHSHIFMISRNTQGAWSLDQDSKMDQPMGLQHTPYTNPFWDTTSNDPTSWRWGNTAEPPSYSFNDTNPRPNPVSVQGAPVDSSGTFRLSYTNTMDPNMPVSWRGQAVDL